MADPTGCPTCSGPTRRTTGMVCQTCGTDYGPGLHSAARNESPRCNCFGRPGTNPGCPAHGNHATRPAESAVDGPTDQGAGETTSGPGWDRDAIRVIAVDMEAGGGVRNAASIRALLADRDRLERDLENAKADRHDLWDTRDKRNHQWMDAAERLTEERDAARADLDAALVTIRGQLVLQRTARRDAAADMLDRAAAKLQAYSDVHSSTVAMLRRWAAEVRTIPPTDRSST